jgi:hypothetical protein
MAKQPSIIKIAKTKRRSKTFLENSFKYGSSAGIAFKFSALNDKV